MLALRIIEKILIIYFGLYLLADLLMYFYSLAYFLIDTLKKPENNQALNLDQYPATVIVPAYNEEVSIVTSVKSLMHLDYPGYEIMVVNDGSSDATVQRLLDNFPLQPVQNIPHEIIKTAAVRRIYQTPDGKLTLVDKENGGKADAINAGLNMARGKFICTIDADSVLERDALKKTVIPFLQDQRVTVTGGQLAASNDTVIKNNRILNARVPRNILVQWQIIEYIKSFLISRLALSRANALLIMSGAFSVFRRKDLLEAGGFLSARNNHPYIVKSLGEGKQTVCEDMEIVVRLEKFKQEQKLTPKTVFVPDAVCWTEVPEKPANLFKQRSRWHQGLGETLWLHRAMIFEPAYGATGLFGMPYYLFFEFLSPVVKIFSLIFVLIAGYYGLWNIKWILLLFVSIILITAVIMSTITAAVEKWTSIHQGSGRDALRYKTFGDWIKLLLAGISAEFSYAFFKIAAQIKGIHQFLTHQHDWKKFERKGIKEVRE